MQDVLAFGSPRQLYIPRCSAFVHAGSLALMMSLLASESAQAPMQSSMKAMCSWYCL